MALLRSFSYNSKTDFRYCEDAIFKAPEVILSDGEAERFRQLLRDGAAYCKEVGKDVCTEQ